MTAPEQAPDDRVPTTAVFAGQRTAWVFDRQALRVVRIGLQDIGLGRFVYMINRTPHVLDRSRYHDTKGEAESEARAYLEDVIAKARQALRELP